MESYLIFGPTVWVSGVGPVSGCNFARFVLMNQRKQNLWRQVCRTSAEGCFCYPGNATSAHYRSKAEILQEYLARFSKIFWLCFLYCKFYEEEIYCTTISTLAQSKHFFQED